MPGAMQQGSAEAKPAAAGEGGVIVTPLMEFLRQKHSGKSSAFSRKALARGRRGNKGKMSAILEEVGASWPCVSHPYLPYPVSSLRVLLYSHASPSALVCR